MGETQVFGFIGDDSGLEAVLQAIEAALGAVEEAATSAAEAITAFSNVAEDLQGVLDGLQENLDLVNEQLGTLDETFTTLTETIDSVQSALDTTEESFSVLDETMNTALETLTAVNAEFEDLAAVAAAAAAGLDTATASADGTTASVEGLGAALQAAQGGLLLIGMALAAAVGGLLSMGSAAEDALAQIQGLAGASSSQMTQYTAALQTMAVQFGSTLASASQGLYFVISAGFAGSNALLVLKNAMMAASAGGVDMQTTADALTTVLNAYKATAQQSGQYTDYLTETVVQGKQTFSDLAGAIGPLAVTASALGISFDQAASAEADLTRTGMDSHKAVLDLDNMLRAVSLSADTTAKTAKGLGLSFDENAYKSMDLIGKLNYLQQISDGNTTAFEKLTGGATGWAAAQILVTNEAGGYSQILGAMQHSLGATQNAFEVSQQTISASLGHVQGALSDVGYQLTIMIAPVVKAGLDALSGCFSYMAQHIQQLMPVIVGLGVFIATVLVEAMWALASAVITATWPFLAVAAAIAGVVAMAIWLYNTFAPVRAIVAAVGEAFRSLGGWIASTVWPILQQLGGFLGGVFLQAWQAVGGWIGGTLWPILRQLGGFLGGVFLQAWQSVSSWVGGTLWPILQRVGSFVSGTFVQGWHQLQEALGIASGAFQTVQTKMAPVSAVAHALWSSLQDVGNTVRSSVGPVFAQLGSTLQSSLIPAWNALKSSGAALWQTLQSLGVILAGVMGPVVQQAVAVFQLLWGVLQGLWRIIGPQLSTAFQQVVGVLQFLWQLVGSALLPVLKVFGAIVGILLVTAIGVLIGALEGAARFLATFLTGIIQFIGGIVQFISGWIEVVTGIFSGFFNVLRDLFTGNFSKIGSDLQAAWGRITDGLHNMVGGLWSMIQGLFKAGVQSLLDFASGFVSGLLGWFRHLADELVGHSIIPDMWAKIVQVFSSAPGKIIAFIVNMVGGILGHIGQLRDRVVSYIEAMATMVQERVLVWVMEFLVRAEMLRAEVISKISALRDAVIDRIEAMVAMVREFILQWVMEFLARAEQLRSQVIAKIQALVTAIPGFFQNLVAQAEQWGADLINNLLQGIESAAGNLINGVKNVAGQVASFLHFSVPDQGPLASIQQWMPDMMAVLAQGLTANIGTVQVASKSVASAISGNLQAPLAGASSVPLPSSVPQSGGDATATLLAQILATLQQQNSGNSNTTVSMQNTITASNITNAQQLYDLLQVLGGYGSESLARTGASL